MERIITRKILLLIINFIFFTRIFSAPTLVTVSGRRLLVNGQPFIMKSFCYHPIPVGQGPTYRWVDDPNIYNTDFPLIKDTGANCIRLYDDQCTEDMLNKAYENGLYVILSVWVNYDANLADQNVRNSVKTSFVNMVNQWKNHPAILMWNIGNEQNYYNGNNSYWYTLVNECAQAAKQVDTFHPVTSVNGEVATIGNPSLKSDDASMQYLDVWGANIYRGPRFYTLFTEYASKSSKPFWIGEFGCDAWNGQTNQEDEDMQASYLQQQWYDIQLNLSAIDPSKVCIGGSVMEWCDEWWQYPNGSWSVQDTAYNYINNGYVDDPTMQYEWQGVVAIYPNSYMRRKRKAYYTLQTLWGGSGIDNPPTINITYPTNNQIVSGIITITTQVTDDKGIIKVEFYLDDILKNTDKSSPYTSSIDTTQISNGTHTVKAIAYDTSGQTAEKSIVIIVQNSGVNAPPTVSITNPANGSVVSGVVNIEANAQDDIGISKVEFYVDNSLFITDTEAPYSWQWNTQLFSNGDHTIKVVAYDNINQTAQDIISVVVNNSSGGDDLPPQVSILSPQNSSVVSGVVNIVVDAQDDKGILKVEFYINNNLYWIDDSSPYNFEWDTSDKPNSTYTIKVVAYDNVNQTAQQVISIIVNNVSDDALPSVNILSPTNNSIVSGITPITVDAQDDKGILKVEFYIEGQKVYEDTQPPYVYNWDTREVSNGCYFVEVKVYDSSNQVSSIYIFVDVNNFGVVSQEIYDKIIAYPNPFKAGLETTKITYKLSNNAQTFVEIYSLSGKYINTLSIFEIDNENCYSLWNGKDINGNIVPIGIYICKITSGSTAKYGKIIVLK
ncbi:MAG: Ig-like domain-containing protein [candidate division WOR-3 bacterium]